MQPASSTSKRQPVDFKSAYRQLLPQALARRIFARHQPVRGRPPKLRASELVMSLVFHCLQGHGSLAGNTAILLRKRLAESSMSQRRQNLPFAIFCAIMEAALSPLAKPKKHAHAFYRGLRLVAIDGSQFSVSNTPAILGSLSKAASRRMKAAFAKVGVAMLVELGIHNPLAAAIGKDGESEIVLARRLLGSLPEHSLLIADRLYGVGAFLVDLVGELAKNSCHFLVRVRSNLKPKMLERFKDGSALMEVKVTEGRKEKFKVREIRGRVRRPRGQWVEVRFWTSLLDWKAYPAGELLALYARRWEQEIMYKQLKVDMRQAELLHSHTVETAAQEIAALVLAHAILARQRIDAAKSLQNEVMRISFGKTLGLVRSLWVVLAAGEGILNSEQSAAMTRRVMRLIAAMALPRRRKRSCPRAVRQPIGSWPRLTKNRYSKGETEYKLTKITA